MTLKHVARFKMKENKQERKKKFQSKNSKNRRKRINRKQS